MIMKRSPFDQPQKAFALSTKVEFVRKVSITSTNYSHDSGQVEDQEPACTNTVANTLYVHGKPATPTTTNALFYWPPPT